MTSSLEKMITIIQSNQKTLDKMESDPCLATCHHMLDSFIYQLSSNHDLLHRGLLLYVETIKDARRKSRKRYKNNYKKRQDEMKQALEYLSTR